MPDYNPVEPIRFQGQRLDAFGRQRTAGPQTLFDYQAEYDAGTLLWENDTTGAGSATHDANEACVDLAVTTASGDKVIRQTRQYHRYQPGKSQLIFCTFVMAAGQSNMDQRVGYFDANNGIFLELTGTTLQLVRRTYTSGSAVDNEVTQANWNLNTLDSLDITKSQILVIDLEWLGVGSVRCGFVIDGEIVYVHQFRNANNLSLVYMTTANLPVRYEIENTAGVAAGATLKAICTSVISEGGFEADRGIPFSISNGTTTVGVTTRRAVLSIRPKTTFNSITNRGQIILNGAALYATGEAAFVEIVYNATLGGSPSFASVDSNSIVEYDVAGTTITGGQVISSFYVPSTTTGVNVTPGAAEVGLLSRLPVTLDIAGTAQINLSVVVTSFSGTTCNASASLSWQELR